MKKIYVIGSGPTAGYIDPRFFANDAVIVVNNAGVRMGLYDNAPRVVTFSHYHEETFELADRYPNHMFHTTMGDQGYAGVPAREPRNVIFYPHYPTKYDFDASKKWPTDGILVGSTGVHGAMHLACMLNATDIVLVGVDCGLLDGESNQKGYQSGNLTRGDVSLWLGRWEMHLRSVKKVLVDTFGVRIYSLNPFVNMNLEGHEWTKPTLPSSLLCNTCGMHCAELH